MSPDDNTPAIPGPTFTGVTLDRAEGARHDPDEIAKLLEDPGAVTVAATEEGVVIEDNGRPALARRLVVQGGSAALDRRAPILLGIEDGSPLFAVDLEALDPEARATEIDGASIVSLRDAGAVLPHSEAGLAAYLTALLNWHRRHRFCANCGAPTNVADGGFSRKCPNCGASHFPRTDPVVIMVVEHDGRLLLGRRPGWPQGRYSVLAGFVAPGETLEEAVVREVREESGIDVYDPRYVASQPWPFPSSLMLGFTSFADGGEPKARDGELEDVRWFALDQVRAAARSDDGELRLPPPVSIARFLIDGWLERMG